MGKGHRASTFPLRPPVSLISHVHQPRSSPSPGTLNEAPTWSSLTFRRRFGLLQIIALLLSWPVWPVHFLSADRQGGRPCIDAHDPSRQLCGLCSETLKKILFFLLWAHRLPFLHFLLPAVKCGVLEKSQLCMSCVLIQRCSCATSVPWDSLDSWCLKTVALPPSSTES